jgi:hypothetical protein
VSSRSRRTFVRVHLHIYCNHATHFFAITLLFAAALFFAITRFDRAVDEARAG